MRSEVASASRGELLLVRTVEAAIAAGETVTTMAASAARERLSLASGVLDVGGGLLASAAANSDVFATRSAVSRFYYAMFQAARSVVYIDFGGDDRNGHQELPKHVPKRFPNRAFWVNQLKDARLLRNSADYDPYPTALSHWYPLAVAQQPVAQEFVALTDAYLVARGV